MENNLDNLTIGTFAKAAGVNVETIRFCQCKGLLPEPFPGFCVRPDKKPPAQQVIAMLDRFAIDHASPNWCVNRWLSP